MATRQTEIIHETRCRECEEVLGDGDWAPIKLNCSHVVCQDCFKSKTNEDDYYPCFSCDVNTSARLIRSRKFVLSKRSVEDLKEKIKKANGTINELNEKSEQDAKKINEFLKRESEARVGLIKCSECENSDNELNIQVCKICAFGKRVDINEDSMEIKLNGTEIGSIAICAVCAIRNHVKKGHEVIDYFPFLRSVQYENHCNYLTPKRRKIVDLNNELKSSIQKIWGTMEEGEKELDKMTEMLLRSKNSKFQGNLVNKLTVEIDKQYENVGKLNKFVNDVNGNMEKDVTQLRESNINEESTNCHKKKEVKEDDSAPITEN